MQTQAPLLPANPSKAALWTGRILSILLAAFFVFDGTMKLVRPKAVVEATAQMGFPPSTLTGMGAVLLASTALFLVPWTLGLGTILLTAYLGGAVAAQVRLGTSAFTVIFPIVFAALVWVSALLRDRRLAAVLPLRRRAATSG